MTTKISAAMFRAMNKRKKPFDPSKFRKKTALEREIEKQHLRIVGGRQKDPREKNYPEDLENLTEGERKLMKR